MRHEPEPGVVGIGKKAEGRRVREGGGGRGVGVDGETWQTRPDQTRPTAQMEALPSAYRTDRLERASREE